jgi:hypothetical protein
VRLKAEENLRRQIERMRFDADMLKFKIENAVADNAAQREVITELIKWLPSNEQEAIDADWRCEQQTLDGFFELLAKAKALVKKAHDPR